MGTLTNADERRFFNRIDCKIRKGRHSSAFKFCKGVIIMVLVRK